MRYYYKDGKYKIIPKRLKPFIDSIYIADESRKELLHEERIAAEAMYSISMLGDNERKYLKGKITIKETYTVVHRNGSSHTESLLSNGVRVVNLNPYFKKLAKKTVYRWT